MVLAPILLISSCSPKTTNVHLPVDTGIAFTDSGLQEIPEKWWYSFEDENLNLLIDSALTGNFNLEVAWYRLQAAQALVDRESADFWPEISASAQGEISQPLSQYAETQQLRLGLDASYELDLWGRIDSRVEAYRLRAEASYEDYYTAILTISAEVAKTWYRLTEAKKQLQLLDEQITTNENIVRLLKNRFGSGLVRSVDILRQQQLLESTQEQRIYAELNLKLLKNRLEVLTGKPPQVERNYLTGDLPSLPPLPETGIPTELIQQRPDVQSSYRILQAADRDLAAAISSRYPRLSFSASVVTGADRVENLFEDWAYSVAGNILAPLFYGGELRAEVNRNEAIKMQYLYEYSQTVLIAFREVEDALVQEKKQRQGIRSLEKQYELAETTFRQLQLEYFNGMSNYLDVLTALSREQELRRELLTSRLQLLEYRIELYKALGGGIRDNDVLM